MASDSPPALTPQVALGVAIALVGIIFTLDNLGLADADAIVRYWPVFPIGVGVLVLMHASSVRDWVIGFIWMAAGGLLLARTLGALRFDLWDLLPLLLVALGIRLIYTQRDRAAGRAAPPPPPLPDVPGPLPAPPGASESGREGRDWRDWSPGLQAPEHRFHQSSGRQARPSSSRPASGSARKAAQTVVAVMCGVERRPRGRFTGAQLVALMGGCELDLRQAETDGTPVYITAFVMWGGIEIRVPDSWVVVNESMALLGGVEDSSRVAAITPDAQRVIVQGVALMGGIEIKN